jgi:hypothetical protein
MGHCSISEGFDSERGISAQQGARADEASPRHSALTLSLPGSDFDPVIRFIENKPAEHTDRASAWIARVWPSGSGKTLYFNDMALKRANAGDANH